MLNEQWNIQSLDDINTYLLERVQIDPVGYNIRILYRVINQRTNNVHYRSIFITGTRISVESNNGISINDLVARGNDIIERELLEGREQDSEYLMASDKETWRELDETGVII